MELLLNFAWLFVCVALGCAVMRTAPMRRRRHSLWVLLAALAVIAVLLFPAISLTDDLNPTIFAAEFVSKRDLLTAPVHSPSILVAVETIGWAALFTGLFDASTPVPEPSFLDCDLSGFRWTLPGRAPPLAPR